jgi:hypothetical protein
VPPWALLKLLGFVQDLQAHQQQQYIHLRMPASKKAKAVSASVFDRWGGPHSPACTVDGVPGA